MIRRKNVRATAKINLFLRVLDRRPDGYHNIETVYQSVGIADCLSFEVVDEGIFIECSDSQVPSGKANLVFRAADLLRQTQPGRSKGIRIEIDKCIPMGSGLGGGSADAAATLNVCNELWQMGLTADQLRCLGSQAGMDVPFLIEGGRAIGRERGDRLERLVAHEGVWAVIAVPSVAISTRWAYERMGERPLSDPPSLQRFVEHLQGRGLREWAGMCHNDFESIVFPEYPQVERLRDRFRREGCAGAFLSGSGAAVVGLTEDPVHAARVAQALGPLCRLAKAVPFLTGAIFDEPETDVALHH